MDFIEFWYIIAVPGTGYMSDNKKHQSVCQYSSPSPLNGNRQLFISADFAGSLKIRLLPCKIHWWFDGQMVMSLSIASP